MFKFYSGFGGVRGADFLFAFLCHSDRNPRHRTSRLSEIRLNNIYQRSVASRAVKTTDRKDIK